MTMDCAAVNGAWRRQCWLFYSLLFWLDRQPVYGCCVSPPHLHTEGKSDNFNLRLLEQGTKRATQNGRDFHYGSCRVCDDGGGGRRGRQRWGTGRSPQLLQKFHWTLKKHLLKKIWTGSKIKPSAEENTQTAPESRCTFGLNLRLRSCLWRRNNTCVCVPAHVSVLARTRVAHIEPHPGFLRSLTTQTTGSQPLVWGPVPVRSSFGPGPQWDTV